MEVWYAHEGTTVVMLTETPEGSSAVAYLLRGMADLRKQRRDAHQAVPWLVYLAVAHRREPPREQVQRFAPRTPEGMHKLLMEKKFTNGADREVVVKLYTNVAERCIYPAEMLDYDGFAFATRR